MTTVTRDGNANFHYMQGFPTDENRSVELSPNFEAPVTGESAAFIKQACKELLDCEVDVKGSLWDYSKSTDDIAKQHIGHFRVELPDGENIVLAVHPYDGGEALALSDKLFEALENRDVEVVRAKPFDNGDFTKEFEGRYIHVESFQPIISWVMEDSVEWLQYDIGRLAGEIYQAGQDLSDSDKNALKEYTDAITIPIMKDGARLISQNPDALPQIPDIDADDALNILEGNRRVPTTMNLIEKMVWIKDDDALVLAAYDSASRGFLPMLTQNATFDAGLAISRIILNQSLYPDSQNLPDRIESGLKDFISGYNEVSGLSLDYGEARLAARRALILLGSYAVGATGNQITEEVANQHINTTLTNMYQNLGSVEYLLDNQHKGQDNTQTLDN